MFATGQQYSQRSSEESRNERGSHSRQQQPIIIGGTGGQTVFVGPAQSDQSIHLPQQYAYIPSTSSFSRGSRSPERHSHRTYNPTSEYAQHGSAYPGTYVAVDPFRPSIASSIVNSSHAAPDAYSYDIRPQPVPAYIYPYQTYYAPNVASDNILTYISIFFLDTLPRQFYLHFLLRLPALYFSRVARIFEEAELTVYEIEKLALSNVGKGSEQTSSRTNWHAISPHYSSLKTTWESFIDSLLREWKTLNIVSVLLLSAILTILQIESAAADPITRNAALFSLVCALMSLLYGCMYIIRFGTMRKTHKAAEWAAEAQKSRTLIWWNVWVLLAMPAVWLSWSIILYITCIMAFVWRTGSTSDGSLSLLSPQTELGPRIAISVVLALGIVYFFLILNTFRLYGDVMDKNWRGRVAGWAREKQQYDYETRASQDTMSGYSMGSTARPWDRSSGPRRHRPDSEDSRSRSRSPTVFHYVPDPLPSTVYQGSPPASSAAPLILNSVPNSLPLFKAAKVLDLRFHNRDGQRMPEILVQRGIQHEDWERFISDASSAWDGDIPMHERDRMLGESPLRPQDVVAYLVEWWNLHFFYPRGTMALLCQEYLPLFPNSPAFTIYLVDCRFVGNDAFELGDRFGSVPEGLDRIDIFDPPKNESSRRRILGRTSIFSTRHPMEGRVHFGTSLRSHSRSSRSPPRQPQMLTASLNAYQREPPYPSRRHRRPRHHSRSDYPRRRGWSSASSSRSRSPDPPIVDDALSVRSRRSDWLPASHERSRPLTPMGSLHTAEVGRPDDVDPERLSRLSLLPPITARLTADVTRPHTPASSVERPSTDKERTRGRYRRSRRQAVQEGSSGVWRPNVDNDQVRRPYWPGRSRTPEYQRATPEDPGAMRPAVDFGRFLLPSRRRVGVTLQPSDMSRDRSRYERPYIGSGQGRLPRASRTHMSLNSQRGSGRPDIEDLSTHPGPHVDTMADGPDTREPGADDASEYHSIIVKSSTDDEASARPLPLGQSPRSGIRPDAQRNITAAAPGRIEGPWTRDITSLMQLTNTGLP